MLELQFQKAKKHGKIVDNYECYIACPMNTSYAEVAKVRKRSNT
jgi:hypothetical protein